MLLSILMSMSKIINMYKLISIFASCIECTKYHEIKSCENYT